MKNLTIRNLPEETLNKLRLRAARHRRSMNSEILIVLDQGLERSVEISSPAPAREVRNDLLTTLAGAWAGDDWQSRIDALYGQEFSS